mgnify:CR=1 FL=1
MKPRFISDLHLSDKNPELNQAFFKFLEESKEDCTHLFILGDLFEAWIGDDDDLPIHIEIKQALKAFTTNGPETFFMHGNRDFLVGESFAKKTGITILPDPYTLEINNQKVVLSHGDFLCTDDVDYINFRNNVRSKNWQKDFLSKDLNERKLIASTMRNDSRQATSQKSLEITDVNLKSVDSFLEEYNPNIFIHGHTHRPKIHHHDAIKRVVLGDWGSSGWYLSIIDNDLDLQEFKI